MGRPAGRLAGKTEQGSLNELKMGVTITCRMVVVLSGWAEPLLGSAHTMVSGNEGVWPPRVPSLLVHKPWRAVGGTQTA